MVLKAAMPRTERTTCVGRPSRRRSAVPDVMVWELGDSGFRVALEARTQEAVRTGMIAPNATGQDVEMVKDLNREQIFPVVKAVVDRHDLESLLKLGSPADEYDRESQEIVDALYREGPMTVRELAYALQHVFHHSYGMWTTPSVKVGVFMKTARDLWGELPKECRVYPL